LGPAPGAVVIEVDVTAAGALLALAASLSLCFSRRFNSLQIKKSIDQLNKKKLQKKIAEVITDCFEIISPVTGSL